MGNKKKFSNIIKKSFKRLKYLDRTKFNYFIVTSFLGIVCLVTGTSYSVFTVSKYLNAANITVAKLNYVLTSENDKYNSGVVNVEAKETLILDLSLKSENAIVTKYALNYTSLNDDVKVYYSQSLKDNMMGEIAENGAVIDMRIVIVNNSEEDTTVNLNIQGGYVQNTLETNITEGYYEENEIIRTILLDENFENPTLTSEFPDGEYLYYKTECSENANPVWDNETRTLELNKQVDHISCDVYFKKSDYDIEVAFKLIDKGGIETISTTSPINDNTYTYKESYCSSGANAIWNNEEWTVDISNVSEKTICMITFVENTEVIEEYSENID